MMTIVSDSLLVGATLCCVYVFMIIIVVFRFLHVCNPVRLSLESSKGNLLTYLKYENIRFAENVSNSTGCVVHATLCDR